ncbi:GtrA family protein [Candidatus Pacearchaeota archaeon CG10_big_fil_rev_8_21_14_0_10_32_14]|nr:MAG: GtrA family protein [Candidatus Pacearchaeota archaeon CG10_big_fil_rev_8_21_14_0_10_32_14]
MLKGETFRQFIMFCFIGVINTLINLIVLYSATEFLGIYYLISAVIAFLFAVTNSFILNSLFTFKSSLSKRTSKRYTKFIVVSIIALIINLSLLYFLTEFFRIWYILSQVIAIAISLWINFVGNKYWTYRND